MGEFVQIYALNRYSSLSLFGLLSVLNSLPKSNGISVKSLAMSLARLYFFIESIQFYLSLFVSESDLMLFLSVLLSSFLAGDENIEFLLLLK